MPTYLYSCPNCGDFTMIHSIKEKRDHCPECGEGITIKINSPPVIHFRGGGFYVNGKE